MLDTVKSFFTSRVLGEHDEPPTEHALRLACAALLLEVSRADFDVDQQELTVVADALKDQFELSAAETAELLEMALGESEDNVSLHPFLRLINENLTMSQRQSIVEDMWRVAYADERLDKYEEHRIRKIAELLYVSHKDFIRAKLRVQDGVHKRGR